MVEEVCYNKKYCLLKNEWSFCRMTDATIKFFDPIKICVMRLIFS